ncbi:hypothetical protein IFM89_030590 [Coptis chinensis]|uniref:Alcohol dehydrogenase-like N-terminal domain-containing protein n=1 Tax=Coptis chinensis TaxID=261450 RepID=A0A835HQP7_9MAGN|nr:hypothetical protein IFM89_030590 [Coptis chinensis]
MEAPVGVYPTIFGHEAIGVVESVGDYVEEVKEGDRVVPSFLANCNECIDCKSEKSNMCAKFQFRIGAGMLRDGTSRFIDSNGKREMSRISNY